MMHLRMNPEAVTTAGVINEKYGITDKACAADPSVSSCSFHFWQPWQVCKGVHAAVAKVVAVELECCQPTCKEHPSIPMPD